MKNFDIALNDTLETRLLLSTMLVNVKYLKYPSIQKPCEEIFSEIHHRKIFHGVIAKYDKLPDIFSNDFIFNIDVEKTKYFFKHSSYPILSMHIGDNLDNLLDDKCLENAVKNINFIRENLETDCIALENMEFLSNLNTLNPEFITKLINKTNTMFLLDTAHATIAANLLNMDIYEYINKLPLNKLCEIHFSGTQIDGNNILSHIKAREEDYKLLEYILNINTPETITIEYGLYDKEYSSKLLNSFPKVSYSKINIEALNEILYMYYRINKLREK